LKLPLLEAGRKEGSETVPLGPQPTELPAAGKVSSAPASVQL
jgi:hypothetical protein